MRRRGLRTSGPSSPAARGCEPGHPRYRPQATGLPPRGAAPPVYGSAQITWSDPDAQWPVVSQ